MQSTFADKTLPFSFRLIGEHYKDDNIYIMASNPLLNLNTPEIHRLG